MAVVSILGKKPLIPWSIASGVLIVKVLLFYGYYQGKAAKHGATVSGTCSAVSECTAVNVGQQLSS
jgi:hypothetical protein